MRIMNLQEMIARKSGQLSGIFQACGSHWERARHGGRFLRFAIGDATARVRAHGYEDSYSGPHEVPHGSYLQIVGHLKEFKGHPIAEITAAKILPTPPDRDLRIRLYTVLDELTQPHLQRFVQAVLQDPAVAVPFFQVYASCRHHHSYPSGLLKHSLECAEIVKGITVIEPGSRDIGVVAALLHDIGKIWAHDTRGRLTAAGRLLKHDQVTLEILAGAMAELAQVDPALANFLRYLWGWVGTRPPRPAPAHVLAEAILAADHISAHLSVEKKVFSTLPQHWQHGEYMGRWYYRGPYKGGAPFSGKESVPH